MKVLTDLDGVSLVRGEADDQGVVIQLIAPSGMADGKYFPAESFTLTTVDAIRTLHAVLGSLLTAYDQAGIDPGQGVSWDELHPKVPVDEVVIVFPEVAPPPAPKEALPSLPAGAFRL